MIRPAQPCDRDRARRPVHRLHRNRVRGHRHHRCERQEQLSERPRRPQRLAGDARRQEPLAAARGLQEAPVRRRRSGGPCGATGAFRPGRRARPEGRSRHQRLGADIHDRTPVRQLLAEDRRSLMPARQEAPRRGRTATPPASSAAADRDSGVVRGRRRHLARRRRRDKPDRSQLGAGRHDHLRDGRLGRGATYRAAKGQPPALRRTGATRLRWREAGRAPAPRARRPGARGTPGTPERREAA